MMLLLGVVLLCTTTSFAALSATDYYANIDPNLKDAALKDELHVLISNNKTVLSYDGVWLALTEVDQHLAGWPCDAKNSSHIPDIYSSFCWAPEKGLPSGGECGNYQKEGDCFNREHSWPNSWWGGDENSAYTDLFLLFPSDGYVNNKRQNMPLGDVDPKTVTYTSTNGCRIGQCMDADESYVGLCFEPPAYLKGDLARSYFYISTAYQGVFTCCEEPAVSKWQIKAWEEKILRGWHALDPVDSTELSRNDAIFSDWQLNRNPFIDHPEWVDQISDF